ncbi:GNAT family N-acetyltransferase [Nisaea nitritireducens]|uniref:GNAT family N-acetyltransferase n=1 Tax=Nisaea nitritireducens TaxID=568392 RepID=UPI0018668060|nr:GNAT family N-acetyltransferase [Nisaea nitritireducens]
MVAEDLTLRSLSVEDAVEVAALTVQLGYDLEAEGAKARISDVLTALGHHTFGAFSGEVLLGYLHCYQAPTIDKGMMLCVQALVVDERVRGSGAGRHLMTEAERLARELGCKTVSLSSNERRTGAHSFYERIGYQRSSRSYSFTKQI